MISSQDKAPKIYMQKLTLVLIPSLIAIILFIATSSYEDLPILGAETKKGAEIINLEFDTYSEGINTILYDVDGSINYTLRAENQFHFNDDRTEIEKPFIRLFQNGKSRWNIVANTGTLPANKSDTESASRTIELSGDVEIFSLDEYGNKTIMSTEYLIVDPDKETLETDHPVTFLTSNLQQSSSGMFANLKINEIIFHSNIRGFYEQIPN